MARPVPVAVLLLACCGGCWSVDSADLDAIGAEHGIVLTHAVPEHDEVEPVASLHVTKHGFYLLGLAPLVRISLEQAIGELALEAAAAGAEGVGAIRFEIDPANPLKFIVFPIPDWSASVEVSGMAWRRRAAPVNADRAAASSRSSGS